MKVLIPLDVEKWATEQFRAMSDNGRLKLDTSDFQAVRELAFRNYGYMFPTASAVAEAFRKALIK